jgi:hypothetical protein
MSCDPRRGSAGAAAMPILTPGSDAPVGTPARFRLPALAKDVYRKEVSAQPAPAALRRRAWSWLPSARPQPHACKIVRGGFHKHLWLWWGGPKGKVTCPVDAAGGPSGQAPALLRHDRLGPVPRRRSEPHAHPRLQNCPPWISENHLENHLKTTSKWFIRHVVRYAGGLSWTGDAPCVARRFACAT